MKISLYIHIPFCIQKCLYCDFLSGPFDQKVRLSYVDALCREIAYKAEELRDYEVISIFFGGGTPSILSGQSILKIMHTVKEGFTLSPDCEVTLEMNPGAGILQDQDKLPFYREAGINRISIGLQSANDSELKKLGRIHTYHEFESTYNLLLFNYFNNLNVDLISAIPDQTLESYTHTLEKVTSLSPMPTHISAYSLIVEENTPFYSMKLNLPDEETERRMYEITDDILSSKGYHRYEISNYAQEGYESRHNKVYWTGGYYIGFGVGASSFFDNIRFKNPDSIEKYIGMVKADDFSFSENIQRLDKLDLVEEYMFLGLRMTRGISVSEFEKRFDMSFPSQYVDAVRKYEAMGLMKTEDDRVFLTKAGINVSNVILSEFLF